MQKRKNCRYVLVSSCNRSGGLHLLSVDSYGGLRLIAQPCKGNVRGFAYFQEDEDLYIARGNDIKILDFDLDFENPKFRSCEHGWFAADPVVDNYMFHDLLFSGDRLFVVVTRFNRVAIIDCVTKERVGTLNIDGARMDMSHINSLCALPEGLLLSMFSFTGKKNLQPWRKKDGAIIKIPWDVVEGFSRSGKCVDTTKDIPPPMVSGLEQPHSFAVHQGWLYYCESFWHRVWRVPVAGGEAEFVYEFNKGYVRGLCVVGDILLIGESCPENHKQVPAHFLGSSKHALVHALDLLGGDIVHTLDIPASAEIYHIAECPGAVVEKLPA